MAIDIFNIQPTTISRDLKGKFVCIYSLPKVGKTSLACQFPKNLLLAFSVPTHRSCGLLLLPYRWKSFPALPKNICQCTV